MSVNAGFGEFEEDETQIVTPSAPVTGSPLDDLRAALKRQAHKEPTTLPVPSRPGVGVKFDCNLDSSLLARWYRSASKANDPDPLRVAVNVIVNQMRGLVFNGVEVNDDEGKPITTRTATIREFLGLGGQATPTEVLRSLYGSDGYIQSVSNKVLELCGYGEVDLEEENPTMRG